MWAFYSGMAAVNKEFQWDRFNLEKVKIKMHWINIYPDDNFISFLISVLVANEMIFLRKCFYMEIGGNKGSG